MNDFLHCLKKTKFTKVQTDLTVRKMERLVGTTWLSIHIIVEVGIVGPKNPYDAIVYVDL